MQLVLIEWMDSFGCSSDWQTLEGDNFKPLVYRSVGWLLHDSDDCKVVVPHATDAINGSVSKQGCGDMTIPTKSVISIKSLSITDIKSISA